MSTTLACVNFPSAFKVRVLHRNAFTLIELLVVLGIISILLGLLMAAVQKARATAARVACLSQLKQLAMALHHYENARHQLPPGTRSILNREGRAFTGWPLESLPYSGHDTIYQQSQAAFRLTAYPFTNPPHPLDQVVTIFTCPSDDRVATAQVSLVTHTRVAFTSYLGVAGTTVAKRDGVLYVDSYQRFGNITDGLSQTLLLGERPPSADYQYGWWYAGAGQRVTGSADMILGVREPNLLPIVSGSPCGPGNYPFRASRFDDPCGMFHFWSPHPGGANFAFADGSVRFLAYSVNDILPKLATRAGGESVDLP